MAEASSSIYRGGLIIVGSMSVIGLVDNFIRHIAAEAGIWQFYLLRAILAVAIIAIYCAWKKQSMMPKRFWAVALRSIAAASAILIYFGSLSVMQIAEAGAALFSSPIFVLVLSVALLGIRIGIWRIAAVAAGFTGVLLVLKPHPGNLGLLVLIPACAGMLYALGQLATRHLCADEDTIVVVLGFFVANAFFGLCGLAYLELVGVGEALAQTAPFFFTGWVEPTAKFWFWTAIQCVGSLIAVSGLIRGYQIADPTYVAVFEYSFVVFAGFWAWVIWNEIPDHLSMIGILMVIAAGIIITLRSKA